MHETNLSYKNVSQRKIWHCVTIPWHFWWCAQECEINASIVSMYLRTYLSYNGGRIFFENLRKSIETTNNVMSYRVAPVNFRQARPLHQHACFRAILICNPPWVSYTSKSPLENIFSQCEILSYGGNIFVHHIQPKNFRFLWFWYSSGVSSPSYNKQGRRNWFSPGQTYS